MTRILLRFGNFPALILLTMIGVAIQSSLFTFWLLPYIRPDLILLVVIWAALRRDFVEGGILTLLLANIGELHSAAPQGTYLSIYMVVFLAVRASARLFVIPDLRSFGIVVLAATVASKGLALGLMHLLGVSLSSPTHLLEHGLFFIFPSAAMNGFISRWIYQWLERFDWVTFKNPRAGQVAGDGLEEELQLDGPGL